MKTLPEQLPANYELVRGIILAGSTERDGMHQTATQIYELARRRQPTIGFATVHRALARLCDMGLVLKIDVPDGDAAWYEPPSEPHAHLVCDACGSLVDVHYQPSARTMRDVAAREGIEIRSESVTFRGRCSGCISSG
jgi:Fe2+ or Zn2+ uptake regulation protein